VTQTKTNVIQYNEYYPFGLQTANSWTRDSNKNDFLYNSGSEINNVSGFYDLPFRNYDASLGRFFQEDPLAHTDHTTSPFAYAGNNPVANNDPSGLTIDYSTSYENQDYRFMMEERARIHEMLSSNNWSTDGGRGGGHWSDNVGTNVYSDAQRVRDGLMTLSDYASKYGAAVNLAAYSPNATMSDVVSVVDAVMNGRAYMVETDHGNFLYTDKSYHDEVKGWYRATEIKGAQKGGLNVLGSGNKITGDYDFAKTGNGWTGEITGLGVAARNSRTNQIVNVELPLLCITIKPIGPNTKQEASDAFVKSWNTMTDRLDNWLDSQGDRLITTPELRTQVMSIFNTQMNMNTLYNSTTVATTVGPCSGNIPVTQAQYSWWDTLFK
jgi:RHS repeat-associated protein